MDVPHDRHIQFDKIRIQLGDGLQARIACSSVIDGNAIALPTIMMQGAGEVAKIADCSPLGDFKRDLFGNQSVVQHDLFGAAVTKLRIIDHFRRDIQKQLLAGSKHFGLLDG